MVCSTSESSRRQRISAKGSYFAATARQRSDRKRPSLPFSARSFSSRARIPDSGHYRNGRQGLKYLVVADGNSSQKIYDVLKPSVQSGRSPKPPPEPTSF